MVFPFYFCELNCTLSYQTGEKVDGVTTNIQALTYDDAGNLLTDGEFTYTWQMGRQLQGITGTDLTTSYKYNENGLRTQKTVNGQTHEYTLLGSSVTREVIRDNAGNILWTIYYSYAGDSTPVSMNVNGTEYYYLKNAQGDITHIVDEEGNEVASYEYDAWGNHLSITGGDIAELNPYRYRGYRYDSESGLYYLQSRYFNPVWGRFINSDSMAAGVGDLLGNNIFIFCFNNPVNMTDGTGYWPSWGKVALGAAIGVIGVAAVIVVAPVALAAISVGYATVAVYGAGAVACGAVATVCGASIVQEGITGNNTLKNRIGEDNFDLITTVSTLCSLDGLSALSTPASHQKSPPNPNGRKGSLAHQAEIAKRVKEYERQGYKVDTEVYISTPGGAKPYRFADFSATRGNTTIFGQVGRQLKSGLPVARERYAIEDIISRGYEVIFFPYNTR